MTGVQTCALPISLVSSDNHAAMKLCEEYPGGEEACVYKMNEKAKELGLQNTNFVEPTGLSKLNTSNAEELVRIVEEASKYPEIIEASHIAKRNTNPTINKYDYDDDKADMKVGDRVIFAPATKGYPYKRCAGKIMNERTVKVFDEHTPWDMEETEFEIGKIKCNPESYKFPNNHVTTRTDSDWFLDHYWYIKNKNWYIAKKYKTPNL